MSSDAAVYAIVITFNGMRWIKQCIDSLQASTVLIDVIVVDNCSTDDSVDFIKSNFPSVHVIALNENIGFGKANNIGIEEVLSRGAKYIFLLNQDARIETRTIQRLIALLQKHPEVGVLSPVHLNGDGSLLDKPFLSYLASDDAGGRQLLTDCVLNRREGELYEVPFVNAAAWLVPRETFELIGGFNPLFFQYGEDSNLLQRVLYHGKKIAILRDTFIYHDREKRGFDAQIFSGANKGHLPSHLIYSCCDVMLNDSDAMLLKEVLQLVKRSIKNVILGRVHAFLDDVRNAYFLFTERKKIQSIVALTRTKGPHFLQQKSASEAAVI